MPIFFGAYDFNLQAVGRVLGGVLFFYVIWGFIWYGVKTLLLKYFVRVLQRGAASGILVAHEGAVRCRRLRLRHSERRIRIADMIGRRGRFITLGMAGFFYLYVQVSRERSTNFATIFLQDNLFDAVLTSWIFLGVLLRERLSRRRVLRSAVARHGRRAGARELSAHHHAVDRASSS